MGELMGKFSLKRKAVAGLLKITSNKLEQNISGIHFANPVGLSAGFDYEARLTQILPAIGFGFETVGDHNLFPLRGEYEAYAWTTS